MPNRLYIRFLQLPLLIRIFFIAIFVFLTFGILIHLLEPVTFPTIFDGIWWAIITASTVGYGDFIPHSPLGRMTAVILILLGAGFVSSYFITLATAAVTRQDALSEGKISYKGRGGHIIIIGWNERSRELILKLTSLDSPPTIVLVDETIKVNPAASKYVHYIQGKAHLDETFLKTNIHQAEKVLITADRGNDELQADMNSILTLLTIKGLCPDVQCIVEILTSEQVTNARRAGADEIIQSNKLASVFMSNCVQSAHTGILSDFVYHLQDSATETVSTQELCGKTFADLHLDYFTNGVLLIGIKREETTVLNPSPTFPIQNGDQLLILKG